MLEARGERACRIFFHPCLIVNSSMETLLHVAAENGHLSIVEVLHQRGASLDLQDENNQTALHRAASRGHSEIVKALLQAGAPMYTMDLQGKTPVHLAAENGHLDTVRVLLKEEADMCESCTRDMFLHMAAKEDDWKLTELLLQSGAAVDAQNDQNKTALFYAVAGGHDKTLTVLLNAGAKVDRDVMNEAIKLNQESVLKLLLGDGANVNICDKQGYTPVLLSAELGGCVPIVEKLLEKGLDPNIIGSKAQTPLHLAAVFNRSDLVGLLRVSFLQVNAVNQDGATPLHLATAARGKNHVVDVLLSTKANADTPDKAKKTALHLAAMEGNVDAVTSLLSHKVKAGAKDMDGSTPLHYAAAGGFVSIVSLLLQSLKKKGLEERNAWRKTPLHAAAEKGHDNVAVLLFCNASLMQESQISSNLEDSQHEIQPITKQLCISSFLTGLEFGHPLDIRIS
uniref:CARD- and ANK-containing Inflammasome Adaptor Protein n=1 Tax=Sphaeramia orbicularis TaxID=375764 RepID=A0A672ZY84_9TELE